MQAHGCFMKTHKTLASRKQIYTLATTQYDIANIAIIPVEEFL